MSEIMLYGIMSMPDELFYGDNFMHRKQVNDARKRLVDEHRAMKEALRWRDAKEEPPEKPGRYFIMMTGGDLPDFPSSSYFDGCEWATQIDAWSVSKWLPIPEDTR